MKPSILITEAQVKEVAKRINDIREPENDWQALLKGIITLIMDDYIRLQHPSRRDQLYLKEAFCASIAALWDQDYLFSELKNEKGEDMSFREILAHRFGLENMALNEIHKLNLGDFQQEVIQEAKAYWLDKQLSVVKIPDFFIFDGRAFSIWKTEEESSVDYENMIINLQIIDDEKEQNLEFIKLTMHIAAYYRDMKIKQDQIDTFSEAWYQILRMNACFRQ